MTRPIRMRGIPASPGIAIARSRVVDRRHIRVPRIRIEQGDVKHERDRLMEAVTESRAQVEKAVQAILDNGGGQGEHSLILQAHLLMLDDKLLVDGTLEMISEKLINAEWALQRKMEEVGQMLANLGDKYLSERSQDVEFVGNRVLRNLLGHVTEILESEEPTSPCIIISSNLSPAETAQMVAGPVLAFATEEGTLTSHTAIMAQALGIPAVVGVERLTDHLEAGDMVIIDGLDGIVIIRPDDNLIRSYTEKAARYAEVETRMRSTREQPAVTTDGVDIQLMCNIELPGEAALALDYGAVGIGLYRTEFLFMDRAEPLGEEEQYRTYLAVMKTMAPRPVVFRTFDLGADKMPGDLRSREKNPALGLRAIRYGLRNRSMFKTQLRALLRTSKYGDLSIMFPMVSGLSELRQTNALLHEARAEVGDIAPDAVKIGCMIELPSAVFVADLLAREADFFSIGTNDLIQYSLAIDRGNDHVAYLYTPYHPSVLRAIKMVIDAGNKAGIPVSMCGSAAAQCAMAPILIGMGFRSLSMSPTSIPFVKATIRSFSVTEARSLASQVLALETSVEIEDTARSFIADRADPDFPT